MPENVNFMDAICADPFNDALRLTYCEWLEERGKPQAELIRLQVEIRRSTCPLCDRTGVAARQSGTYRCPCGQLARIERCYELICNVKDWWNRDIHLQVNEFKTVGFDRGLLGVMEIGRPDDIDLPECKGVFGTHPIVAVAVASATPLLVLGRSSLAGREPDSWRWLSGEEAGTAAATVPLAVFADLAASAQQLLTWPGGEEEPAVRATAPLRYTSLAAAVWHLSAALVQRGRKADGLPPLDWRQLMSAARDLVDVDASPGQATVGEDAAEGTPGTTHSYGGRPVRVGPPLQPVPILDEPTAINRGRPS